MSTVIEMDGLVAGSPEHIRNAIPHHRALAPEDAARPLKPFFAHWSSEPDSASPISAWRTCSMSAVTIS